LCLLLVCPVYTWIVLLYSLQNTEWREKAMFLVIIEGFLSSSPQLLLQLSLWFKGVLTLPAAAVIDGLPALQENITHRHSDFQFLGRSYDEEGRVVFGMVQLVSILISLTSVLASGIYFNDLETGVQLSSSRCRKCVGVPFFLTTILHRAVSIALVICFLEWWSSLIIFGLFFLTVLMSVCAGDLFSRACAYGVWSQLLPVGFARDPLESLGYKVYTQYSIADTAETQFSSSFLKRRAKYFICSHLAISTAVLLPALIIATVLVNQAGEMSWLDVNTKFIFKFEVLNMIILPGTGVLLALSVLLGRVYQALVYKDFKKIQM